jgi:hypothetical protein
VVVIGDHRSKRAVSSLTRATEYGHPTAFIEASHIVRSKRKGLVLVVQKVGRPGHLHYVGLVPVFTNIQLSGDSGPSILSSISLEIFVSSGCDMMFSEIKRTTRGAIFSYSYPQVP